MYNVYKGSVFDPFAPDLSKEDKIKFLLSDTYCKLLTDFARGLTGNPKIRVVILPPYSDSLGYTDGNTIYLCTVHEMFIDLPIDTITQFILAVAFHEPCHVMYTDFKYWVSRIRAVGEGQKLYKWLFNSICDARIERIGGIDFPGIKHYLVDFRNYFFDYDNNNEPLNDAQCLLNNILLFATCGKVKYQMNDVCQDAFNLCRPYIIAGRRADTTVDCDKNVAKIFDIVYPIVKSEMEMPENPTGEMRNQKNQKGFKKNAGTGGADTIEFDEDKPSDNSDSEDGNDSSGKSSKGSNKNSSKSSKSSSSKSNDGQENDDNNNSSGSSKKSKSTDDSDGEDENGLGSSNNGDENDSSNSSNNSGDNNEDGNSDEEGNSSDESSNSDGDDNSDDGDKSDNGDNSDDGDNSNDGNNSDDGDDSDGDGSDDSDSDSDGSNDPANDSDDSDAGGQGGDPSGSSVEDIEAEASRSMLRNAIEGVVSSYENEKREKALDNDRMNDLESTVSGNVRVQCARVNASNSPLYAEIIANANPIITHLITEMRKVINWNQDEICHKQGRGYLDPQSLTFAHRGTCFGRRIEKSEEADLFISIIVDSSGSMSGQRLMNTAVTTAIILEACSALKIPVSVKGFSSSYSNCDITHYWDYQYKNNNCHQNLVQMYASGGTPLAEALHYEKEYLSKVRYTDKLCFVLTDGEPNSTQSAIAELAQLSRSALVYGVAIGDDVPELQNIFGDNRFIDARDIKTLPFQIGNIIKRNIIH